MKINQEKGFMPAIAGLAVLVILAAAGAGVWYFTQTSRTKPVLTQNAVERALNSPGAGNTAGWLTDTDYEHGFEIKYPDGWVIQGNEIHDSGSNAYLAISKLENPKNLSLDDWWEDKMIVGGRPTVLYNSKNITINGFKAKIADMPPDKSGWHIHIIDRHNNIYSLVAEGSVVEKSIFTQILATFKFIENSDVFSVPPQTRAPVSTETQTVDQPVQGDGCASFFSGSDTEYTYPNLPVTCDFNIGKAFEGWKFIVTADQEKEQYAMEINDGKGGLIQTITVGGDFVSLFSPDSIPSRFIKLDNDINFDGYKDIQVIKSTGPVDVELELYGYWIFDPALKKFQKNPELSSVVNPKFDKNKKMIVSAFGVHNGCFSMPDCIGGGITTYKFNGKTYQNLYNLGNLPKFDDFPVEEIYTGKGVEVNFSDQPLAEKFNKEGGPGGAYLGLITSETAKGPNFAGHYRCIKWGCGSNCVTAAIIDVANGVIVYSPFKGDQNNRPNFDPWENLDYRAGSTLLAVNGRYYDWSPTISTQIVVEGIE